MVKTVSSVTFQPVYSSFHFNKFSLDIKKAFLLAFGVFMKGLRPGEEYF